MRLRPLSAIALLFAVLTAHAQNTPAPVAMPAVPPHNCVIPEYPGKLASNTRINAFNREFKGYGECIKKYIDDTKALTNAAIEAGNKAIDEYNKAVKDIKAQTAADK